MLADNGTELSVSQSVLSKSTAQCTGQWSPKMMMVVVVVMVKEKRKRRRQWQQ